MKSVETIPRGSRFKVKFLILKRIPSEIIQKKIQSELYRNIQGIRQGGTSALMSSGFMSDIRAAKQGLTVDDKGNVIKGDPWYLTSLITVHKQYCGL